MDSLVPWLKKRDKYNDETDGDFIEAREPKLTNTIQEPEFINRDSTNAKAMKVMKIKW